MHPYHPAAEISLRWWCFLDDGPVMWLCCIDELLLKTLEPVRGGPKPREPRKEPQVLIRLVAAKARTVMFPLQQPKKSSFLSLTFNQAFDFGVRALSFSSTTGSTLDDCMPLGNPLHHSRAPSLTCCFSAQKSGPLSWPQLRCHFSRNPSLTPTPTLP